MSVPVTGATQRAIDVITAERMRQVTEERFGDDRDDRYVYDELATAAATYALPRHVRCEYCLFMPCSAPEPPPSMWPWDSAWWKPSPEDRIRELAKAGALIVAEIERLERAAGAVQPCHGDSGSSLR